MRFFWDINWKQNKIHRECLYNFSRTVEGVPIVQRQTWLSCSVLFRGMCAWLLSRKTSANRLTRTLFDSYEKKQNGVLQPLGFWNSSYKKDQARGCWYLIQQWSNIFARFQANQSAKRKRSSKEHCATWWDGFWALPQVVCSPYSWVTPRYAVVSFHDHFVPGVRIYFALNQKIVQ